MAVDAVTAITNDHRVMEQLFEQCRTNRDRRRELVAEIKVRLTAHARAEEEQVYPELARIGEADEAHHGTEEHHEAEEKLARLEAADPRSAEFDDALEDFVEAVKHHVEEEETDLLPTLEESVDRTRLEELGERFEEQRVELLSDHGYDSGAVTSDETKAELYEHAKEADIPGRSSMNKDELARALRD